MDTSKSAAKRSASDASMAERVNKASRLNDPTSSSSGSPKERLPRAEYMRERASREQAKLSLSNAYGTSFRPFHEENVAIDPEVVDLTSDTEHEVQREISRQKSLKDKVVSTKDNIFARTAKLPPPPTPVAHFGIPHQNSHQPQTIQSALLTPGATVLRSSPGIISTEIQASNSTPQPKLTSYQAQKQKIANLRGQLQDLEDQVKDQASRIVELEAQLEQKESNEKSDAMRRPHNELLDDLLEFLSMTEGQARTLTLLRGLNKKPTMENAVEVLGRAINQALGTKERAHEGGIFGPVADVFQNKPWG